jgi:hypothetical protein
MKFIGGNKLEPTIILRLNFAWQEGLFYSFKPLYGSYSNREWVYPWNI